MEMKVLIFLCLFNLGCSTLKTNKAIFVTRDMERSLQFNENIFDHLVFNNEPLEKNIIRKCLTDDFSNEVEKMLDLLKLKITPLVYIEVGVCYQLAGEFPKALYYYDQGLSKLNKKQKRLKSVVFNNLAIMYSKRDQFHKGYSYLEKALVEQPNNFVTIYNLALVLTSVGRYDESISLIKKFRGTQDEQTQLNKILGIDYLSMNDMSSLESKVINRLDDNLSEKTFLRAVVKYYKTGDSKVVYELIEDLDDLNPIYKQLYKDLIRILKQKIRDDERKQANTKIFKSGGIKNS